VYQYVYRRVGARDADDVTGEVFVKAWRAFAGFRGPSFDAWIFRIAHAQVTDLLRRRGRAPQEDGSMATAERVPAPDPADQVETGLLLAAHLRRLPAYQRTVVELRFFAGLRHQDIARVLGKREGAVKVALQRGLLKLHDALLSQEEALR
jgi:RNA polymerase sigma-70 factor (ECF subfamily)